MVPGLRVSIDVKHHAYFTKREREREREGGAGGGREIIDDVNN